MTNCSGLHPQHHTDFYALHERARDGDGDGIREVHGNTSEGLGALRTFLRVFRGIHNYSSFR